MMRSRLSLGDDFALPYGRHRGIWAPRWIARPPSPRSIAAWTLTILGAVALVAGGGLIGLEAARPGLDASSLRFAVTAADAAAASNAQGRARACLGHAAINPLPAPDLITAQYACPIISAKGQDQAVVAMSLRYAEGAWRIASLFTTPADKNPQPIPSS